MTQNVSQASTTTTLGSSSNPSPYGQSVSLTATVSPSAATGNVTFQDGSTTLGSASITNGIATLTVNTLSGGAHPLTAAYGGDTNNLASTSATFTQTVNPSATTISLTSSANPAAYGQSFTLTAAVTPSQATGNVTFKEGPTPLGSGTLNGGTAMLTVSTLSGGAHSVTAVYSGDANDAASTSSTFNQTINPAATSTTLIWSINPSTYGQGVTLTATVSTSASGSVTFKDGSATLGSNPLNGGSATLALTTLAIGAHALTAVYSGDANSAASTSPALTQTVNPAASTTTLNSLPNPSTSGQSVTLTATVSSAGSGSVTFQDASATMGSSPLNNGTATFTVTTLSIGAHALMATYGGDANNAASTSQTLTHMVTAFPTAATLNASPNPSTAGQSVTLTATVSPSKASGNVTFMDGPATVGSSNLNSGTATLAVTTLSAGNHSLLAIYSGDAIYATSTSAPLNETVNAIATTTTLTSSANPSAPGQPVTLTATVSPSGSGSVTFQDGPTTLGDGTLSGRTATLTVSTLPVGFHGISATYSGDLNNAPSISAILNQTVNGLRTVVPCPLNFNYTVGQATPAPSVCQFTALVADSFAIPLSSISPWIQIDPMSGQIGTSPASFTISVNPTGLTPGSYPGGFTIAGPTIGEQTIPVQLTVAPIATLLATPGSLSINYQQGSAAPPPQTLTISSTNQTQLPFTVTTAGGDWLTTGVNSGTTPQPFSVIINPAGLDPNTYAGTLTISSPDVAPIVANVTLTVSAQAPPQLNVNPSPLTLAAVQGLPPTPAQIVVANAGGGVLNFSAASSGGAWLNVSPASGIIDSSASSGSSLPVIIACDPTSLDPGTYTGSVTIAATDSAVTVPVTFSVAAPAPMILLSQAALNFTAVSQGGVPLPQQLAILNTGTGTMDWAAAASTLSGGDWLLLSSSAGTVLQPFLDVAVFSVSVDPTVVAALPPGDYYGQIQITGPAADSPQLVNTILTILPPGSDPGPEVSPSSLIFTGLAGVSPEPQNVTVAIRKAVGDQYLSALIGTGFTYSPSTAALQPNQPNTIQVVPDFAAVSPGEIDRGIITLQFSDGTVRTINTLAVVAPSDPASSCSNLMLQWRAPSSPNFTVVQGSSQTLELQAVDNCGNLTGPGNPGAASLVAGFSNQDASVILVHVGNGIWTGTWKPANPSSVPVTVSVTAFNSTPQGLQSGQASPLLATILPGTTPSH